MATMKPAEPHPLTTIQPTSIDPGWPKKNSESPLLATAAPPHVNGLAVWVATTPGAPRNVLDLAGELRRCLRATWQPAGAMGLGPAEAERLAPYYRPDPAVRAIFHKVDQQLSSLAAVGLGLLAEFAELGLKAATAESRLREEIRQREESIASIKRVLEIYTAARASSAPAVSARR